MKIIPLKKNLEQYSCNSYLILGDWNRIGDVNTLIDPGIDDFVVQEIQRLSTGVGKVAVEQVILTHNHFDHAAGVQAVKERYRAKVLAFADGPGVDELLPDGRFVKAGDDFLEVVHVPGHSSDSICLYAFAAKALFVGDTPFKANGDVEIYTDAFLKGIERIAAHSVDCIYPGHDDPITEGCDGRIGAMLKKVRRYRSDTCRKNEFVECG